MNIVEPIKNKKEIRKIEKILSKKKPKEIYYSLL